MVKAGKMMTNLQQQGFIQGTKPENGTCKKIKKAAGTCSFFYDRNELLPFGYFLTSSPALFSK